MARRPFFSGNYRLGSNANAANLIAQAGAAQGQMLQNLGSDIGGMIQQYGLNKEKQKENKATIKSSVGILERMKKLDPENEPQYMMQIEQLNNEDMGLGMRAKLADKTLQGLSITSRLQSEILNAKEQEQNLKIAEENLRLTSDAATAKEAAYKSIDAQIDQIEQDILNGMSYEDMPRQSRFLLANKNFVKTRQIPIQDLFYNPSEELDEKTALLNFEILQGEKKMQDSNIKRISAETASVLQSTKDAREEASILPDFTDRKQALASVQELPKGFSAKLTKFKDGFNVEYDYTKEAIDKLEPLDGFSRDTYLIGGNPYEKDPESKRLVKVVADRSDLNPQELNTIISTMQRRPDLDNYSKAKLRAGEPDEDGFYVFEVAGIEQKIPVNRQLEQDLLRLRRYENRLENMIDFDASSL